MASIATIQSLLSAVQESHKCSREDAALYVLGMMTVEVSEETVLRMVKTVKGE